MSQVSATGAEDLGCRSSSHGGDWTVVGSSQPVWASAVGSVSWEGAGGGVGSRGGSSGAEGIGGGGADWEMLEAAAVVAGSFSGGLWGEVRNLNGLRKLTNTHRATCAHDSLEVAGVLTTDRAGGIGCGLTEGEAAAEPLAVEVAPQVDSVLLPHAEAEIVAAWVSEVLAQPA